MLLDCSNALLLAVKKKQSSEVVRISNLFETFSFEDAIEQLDSDIEKTVFWVNVYNAYFQIKAVEKSKELLVKRNDFFKTKQILLFGLKLSFDDIEHGILRRSKWKVSLGFINKPFPKKWEKALRVKQLDFRIHFLLNCGAVSCPIIFPLSIENFDKEIEEATKAYLFQEVFIPDHRIILNRLFLFYIADFGGGKGLKQILLAYNIINKEQMNYKFKFTEFDKATKLDNFVEKNR
jgi:hypothetical protein